MNKTQSNKKPIKILNSNKKPLKIYYLIILHIDIFR